MRVCWEHRSVTQYTFPGRAAEVPGLSCPGRGSRAVSRGCHPGDQIFSCENTSLSPATTFPGKDALFSGMMSHFLLGTITLNSSLILHLSFLI